MREDLIREARARASSPAEHLWALALALGSGAPGLMWEAVDGTLFDVTRHILALAEFIHGPTRSGRWMSLEEIARQSGVTIDRATAAASITGLGNDPEHARGSGPTREFSPTAADKIQAEIEAMSLRAATPEIRILESTEDPPGIMTIDQFRSKVEDAGRLGHVRIQLHIRRSGPPGRGGQVRLPLTHVDGRRRYGPRSEAGKEVVRGGGKSHYVGWWLLADCRRWLKLKASAAPISKENC